MNRLLIILLAGLFFSVVTTATAQIRTEGTKTEIDSATGKTTTTSYVNVKKEEDVTPRHDMIIINPLKFFFFYNLSYYHSFDRVVAAGIGAQIPTISGINGFGLNAEVRLYPSKRALRGFYVAPNISYNHLSTDLFYSESYSPAVDVFSVGVLLGWQWFIGDDFAIGLGLGIDKYFAADNSNGYVWYSSYTGVTPALRFDIGYAW